MPRTKWISADKVIDQGAVTPGGDLQEWDALYIGTGGTGTQVVVETISGNVATYKNYPSGEWMPVNTRRVLNGTTASDIVGVTLGSTKR